MAMPGGEYWTTSSAAGADDRTVQWQEMLSATHLPWSVRIPSPGRGRPFEAWIRRWWIGDLALVDCECTPCSGTRQRRHLAGTEGEFVIVLMTRTGRETVSQGDAEAAPSGRATRCCGTAPGRPGSPSGSRWPSGVC